MKRHVSGLLLLALWTGGAHAGQGDVRLPAEVQGQEQLIELDIDPAKTDYHGHVRLTLRLGAATPRIAFHSVEHQITKATLSKDGQPVPVTMETRGPQRVLVAKTPFAPGNYIVELDWSAKFATQGLGMYRAVVDGQAYILTQFESDYARLAFPCLDEPGQKFPYQITVRVPKAAVVVSNTPIEKEAPLGERKQVTFKKTPPTPSYLLALAVGPFDSLPIEGMGVPGRVYTQKGKGAYGAELTKVAGPIVVALEKYFGRKYPYDKLDFIAAPEFLYGGMENPGAIVYRDSAVLLRPEDVTQQTRNRLVELVSHEVAHIWFGDLVTMKWWDDLWLNESFASWMETKVTEEVAPELRAGLTSVDGTNHALDTDSRKTTRAIRKAVAAADNFEELIDELTYLKGQSVLEMFESYLGRAKFQTGVVQYMNAFAWKNTSADDLWQKLGEAAGVDVKRAMSTFLDQPGAPLITVTKLGKGRVRVEQQRLGAGAPQQWIVPIVLKYSDGTTVKQHTLLLDQPKVEVELPVKNLVYVHPNADERGYYRWTIGAEEQQAMLEHLADLSVRERLGLLSNGSALFRLGLLGGDRLLRVFERLTDDSDLRVQGELAQALDRLQPLFEGTPAEAPFRAFAQKQIAKLVAKLSAQPKPNEKPEESELRNRLFAEACNFGDANAIARGKADLAKYLADEKSVSPPLIDAILICGTRGGDRALFETLKSRFEKADAPLDRARFLTAMFHIADLSLFEVFLDYFATGPLRVQEMMKPLSGMGWTESRRKILFAFTKQRYAEMTKRVPPSFRAFLPRAVLPRCDAAALAEGKAFFMEPARRVDGVEQDLGRVEDGVDECLRVRATQVAVIVKALVPAPGKKPKK